MFAQLRKLTTVLLISGVICLLGVSLTSAQQGGVYSTLADYENITGEKIEKFSEAPMLKIKVATGELPSVEERLPEEPLVVEPLEEIGKYGGTLYRHSTSPGNYGPAMDVTREYLLFVDRECKEVIPSIAKDWKISEDGRTFTLYLRKGMKWSDGAPFTVDDILFWWEDVMLDDNLTKIVPSQWKPGGELIELKKINDYAIEYHSSKSYWALVYNFASGWIRGMQGNSFLPKHALKKYHIKYNSEANKLAEEEGYDSWWKLFNYKKQFEGVLQVEGIPSLGPWILKEVRPDGVIFERNPYYYRIDTAGNQLPYIDKIRGIFTSEKETELMQDLTGKVDLRVIGWPLSKYPLLKENEKKGGYRIWLDNDVRSSTPPIPTYFLNQNYPGDPIMGNILRDVKFRRALSLAINREEIKEVVGMGFGVPQQATVHPDCSFYEDWWAESYAEYSPEKANELLDEMGLKWDEEHEYRLRPDSKPLNMVILMIDWGTETHEIVKEYWEKVGVKTTIDVAGWEYFVKLLGAGDFYALVWVTDLVLEPAFILSQATHFKGGMNSAMSWNSWWNSNGETGTEPPAEVKHIWSLCESLPFLSAEEKNKAAKEICSFQAENIWFIGMVARTPTVCLANVNLINLNEEGGIAATADLGAGTRAYRLEEVFWSDVARRME